MDMNAFLPPMAGSFSGVLAAFAINYWYQSHKNSEDKKKYKAMIRSEIELCLNILGQDRVRILPIDRWISTLNSGALRLFDVDIELEPLTRAYDKIQAYNQDVKFSFICDWWPDVENSNNEDCRKQREERKLLLRELDRSL